jgi:glucosamine--fructose-6-phosphate aminotransferase (isomerizing)
VRGALRGQGYVFSSDTDTEVVAHLVHSKLKTGLTLFDAVQRSLKELEGAYAIAVIAADDPSRLVVARMGAPLLLGIGEGENFAASDTSALLQVTRRLKRATARKSRCKACASSTRAGTSPSGRSR